MDAVFAGRYVVTEVTHTIDADRGYLCELSSAPPEPRSEPIGQTHAVLGTVSGVDDPDGLGRVQVTMPTLRDVESSWMEVVSVGAGSGKGLVALVKADRAPGAGSVLVMKNLYLAFRANTIDQVIESQPNEARYYVGYVGWRPGELKSEIDKGLWSVLSADLEVVFRKDTEGLWEELQQQSKRIRADLPAGEALALLR